MTLDLEDALRIVEVLSEHVGDSEVVDMLNELDISIDNDDINTIDEDDFSTHVISIFFKDYLKWNATDIIEAAKDNSIFFTILNDAEFEKVVEYNTDLFDYFADKIQVGYFDIDQAFSGSPYGWNKKEQLSNIADEEIINLDEIHVNEDCSISTSLAREIIEKYLEDNYIKINDIYLLNTRYKEEYIEQSISNAGDSGFNIKPYISKLSAQLKGHEKDLEDECNMTIEEFKELTYLSDSVLGEFLVNHTDIVDLVYDDFFN